MNPLQHFELLRRYDRALNLRSELIAAVRPGARVLDAGCGVGLLSFWALQGGASEVVAVDLFGVELAENLARENGFDDGIQFIHGDLWSLDLADRRNEFDVIAAMVYLNDPRRDEQQSALSYFLRDRYLARDGKMIPDRVRYFVRACDWPSQDHVSRQSDVHARIADLEGRYGLRFGALAAAIGGSPSKAFFPEKGSDGRLVLDSGRIISEPTSFAEIDYRTAPVQYPEAFEIVTNGPGIFNTLIWTQELWYEQRLLFSNESVSWIDVPHLVNSGTRCTIQADDLWRRTNVATITQSVDPNG